MLDCEKQLKSSLYRQYTENVPEHSLLTLAKRFNKDLERLKILVPVYVDNIKPPEFKEYSLKSLEQELKTPETKEHSLERIGAERRQA